MFRNLLTVAGAIAVGLASLGFWASPASAKVIYNEWLPAATTTDNPCEPGTSAIQLSGLQHHVWYTTPQGTLKMHINAHLTGTDADGTKYVVNMQRHMEHFNYFDDPSSLQPFTDTFTQNLVSKGSTVNAKIVMTYVMYPSNPVVTVTACRG